MTLRYSEAGVFRIMQVTDLHLGSFPANENDQKTFADLRKMVLSQKPDLIIFTGDIIYSLEEHGVTEPEAVFTQFVDFINELKVSSAITFGNHDAEGGRTTRKILRQIYEDKALYKAEKSKSNLTDDRESYVLELKSSRTDEVKNAIFVLDSGAYSNTEYSYYAWLLPEQVSWYRKTAASYLQDDGIKRQLIFQHIPIPEYWLAAKAIKSGAFNESLEMNKSWADINLEEDSQSFFGKNYVGSPEVNTGMFFEMLRNDETWGMFAGHDHDNSFVGLHKGIHLVYGQSSGYNTYGSEPKGVRMIELNEAEQLIKTYSVIY